MYPVFCWHCHKDEALSEGNESNGLFMFFFFHIFSRWLLFVFAFQCKLLDTFPLEAGTYDPSKRVIPFLPGESLHRARPCNVLYLITWLTLRALLWNSVKLITAQFQFFKSGRPKGICASYISKSTKLPKCVLLHCECDLRHDYFVWIGVCQL